MEEKMTFKVINDEGKEIECEVLFTFESDETGKNYIVYTDNMRKVIQKFMLLFTIQTKKKQN